MPEQHKYVTEVLSRLLERYPVLRVCETSIREAYRLLQRMYESGGCLYIAGNGGSAADSGHIAGELMKAFTLRRAQQPEVFERYGDLFAEKGTALCSRLERGLPAIPLPAMSELVTAIVNDISADYIYAQPLNAVARSGDAFWGISTSGNSNNIVNAMMVACAKNMFRIGLTGAKECRLDELCNVVIHVPEGETFRIQELHQPVYHALCEMLERHFFTEK